MDMEKVIKGLQAHADGCGYRSHHCDAMECPYRYGDESCDIEEMCRDAIALLKKHEAVETGIAQDLDGIFATCGNCKTKLWKIMGLEIVVNPDEMPRFCPHCERKVKWSAID